MLCDHITVVIIYICKDSSTIREGLGQVRDMLFDFLKIEPGEFKKQRLLNYFLEGHRETYATKSTKVWTKGGYIEIRINKEKTN